jgi:hypothetical protein
MKMMKLMKVVEVASVIAIIKALVVLGVVVWLTRKRVATEVEMTVILTALFLLVIFGITWLAIQVFVPHRDNESLLEVRPPIKQPSPKNFLDF